MILPVRIKLTGGYMPERKTSGAIGYDVFVPEDTVINPGRNRLKLGFSMQMPDLLEAKVEARSGFSANGMEGYYLGKVSPDRMDADVIPGKIDPDYRGEPAVIIRSCETVPFILRKGTRIAQMTFYRTERPPIMAVEELSDTVRGEGGFGSTGSGGGNE